MTPQVVVAAMALIVSVVSFIITIITYRLQIDRDLKLKNLAAIAPVELLIAGNSSLLRFHGITESELAAAGITAAELAYLIGSFSAGATFFDRAEDVGQPLPADGYRVSMLRCDATRRAWPFVKRFLDPGVYVDRIERTLAALDLERQPNDGPIR